MPLLASLAFLTSIGAYIKWLLFEVVDMACLCGFILWYTDNYQWRSIIAGSVCITFNIGAYIHEFMTMYHAIRAKSLEEMPLLASVAFLASSVAWTVFACVAIFDPFFFVINLVGVIVAALELFIHGYIYKTTKLPNVADRLVLYMMQCMAF